MFTYDPATKEGKVRLLVGDTDAANPIFDDSEIAAALELESGAFLFVSPQRIATATSISPPVSVVSIYRAAAVLLDALASNKARLTSVVQLLDVKLAPAESAKALRDLARSYREVDENAGHYAIAEMVRSSFSARERVLAQAMRMTA